MAFDSTTGFRRPATLLAFGLALVSLGLVAALSLSGHHVAWTSWALPLLILGNLTLMSSGLARTRPRLAIWLSACSIALALALLAAGIIRIWTASRLN